MAGKKIVFSAPSEPMAEMEKQQERAPAKTIGSMRNDPVSADFVPSVQQPILRKSNKRDSEQEFYFGSDSTKSDSLTAKDSLLSPHVKSPSFDKGWATNSDSSASWRSSLDSRDDTSPDYRNNRSGSENYRRSTSPDAFPDQERAGDALKRQFDRLQKNSESLVKADDLQSMMQAPVPPVSTAPAETVSPMHDSLWAKPDERPSLSSHLYDSSTAPTRDSFSSTPAGRSHYSSGDGGRSGYSSGYQSRSLSSPYQQNSQSQRSMYLPVPQSPSSVFK